jgi:hypothetical protein
MSISTLFLHCRQGALGMVSGFSSPDDRGGSGRSAS